MQPKAPTAAVLTGFEPATSTLTGWRALRLLYRTMFREAWRSSLARAYHPRGGACRVLPTLLERRGRPWMPSRHHREPRARKRLSPACSWPGPAWPLRAATPAGWPGVVVGGDV